MNETLITLCTEWMKQKEEIEKEEGLNGSEENIRWSKIRLYVFIAVSNLIWLAFLSSILIPKLLSRIRSRRIGKVTHSPIIPFSMNGFKSHTNDKSLMKYPPNVRIQTRKQIKGNLFCQRRYTSHNGKEFAEKVMKNVCKKQKVGLRSKYWLSYCYSLPNTRSQIISISMNGFKFGTECHDFIPIDGASSDGYYTYQMFGDNRIQVTNYVENGVSYHAGFCIYLEDYNDFGTSWRKEVVEDVLNSKQYSERNQGFVVVEENRKPKEEIKKELNSTEGIIVKYCPRLQREKPLHMENAMNVQKLIHFQLSLLFQ